ncbi:ribosome biogenesis GTP-binding protein YihA/YsxC, partial [Thermodesulfobacteriota bacterium]
PRGFPKETLPEIAFAGRSNVGKSSLINTLLSRRGLARTSRTPGRTQAINFFKVNGRFYFVDLPGYGYAKVPKKVRLKWGPMVESYLRDREPLRAMVLLLDPRRDPGDEDRMLIDYLAHYGIAEIIALTKSDKLKRGAMAARVKEISNALGRPKDHFVTFSAQNGDGKSLLWKKIEASIRQKPAGGRLEE